MAASGSHRQKVDGGRLTVANFGFGTFAGLTVSLDNGGTLSTGRTPLSALHGMTVDFGANGGTFVVNSSSGPADLSGVTINGFVAGTDKIEFTNLAGTFKHFSVTDLGNSTQLVTIFGAHDKVLGSFTVTGTSLSDATLKATVSGDSITFSDPPAAPCFLSGTRIRTPEGEVNVENIKAGDLILTADGRIVPVRWVGAKKLSHGVAQAAQLMPVCIQAGALADNVPSRDLYVSPDHAMYLDGMLVPAQYLLNGVSITQSEQTGTITYHHVETDPHEIIVAENAETESSSRHRQPRQLHEFGDRPPVSYGRAENLGGCLCAAAAERPGTRRDPGAPRGACGATASAGAGSLGRKKGYFL